MVDWENLPSTLVGEIGERLPSRLEIVRFRSICKQWRSSLPSPSLFPLQVPHPPNCDPHEYCRVPYFITEATCYSSDSMGYDNMLLEGVDQGGKCYRAIYVPPLKFKLKDKCPMISLMRTPTHKHFQVYFQSKAYRLRMALPHSDLSNQSQWDLQYSKFGKKMVLISSSGKDGVNPSYMRVSDLSAVVLLSWGNMKGRLALLSLGGMPESWNWDTNFCSQVFEDIATYRGRLCTLDHLGRVFLMDYYSLHMTEIAPPSSIPRRMLEKRLLFEAHGDLYLFIIPPLNVFHLFFIKFPPIRTPGSCYKLSLRLRKWQKLRGRIWQVTSLFPFLDEGEVVQRAESRTLP